MTPYWVTIKDGKRHRIEARNPHAAKIEGEKIGPVVEVEACDAAPHGNRHGIPSRYFKSTKGGE